MEAMAKRSVDGTVDLDYAPSGVTWRLTCPAANALEPRERDQISGENRTDGATLPVVASMDVSRPNRIVLGLTGRCRQRTRETPLYEVSGRCS
jgi:hypothetical protein